MVHRISVMDRRPVQCVPHLSPYDSQGRLQACCDPEVFVIMDEFLFIWQQIPKNQAKIPFPSCNSGNYCKGSFEYFDWCLSFYLEVSGQT